MSVSFLDGDVAQSAVEPDDKLGAGFVRVEAVPGTAIALGDGATVLLEVREGHVRLDLHRHGRRDDEFDIAGGDVHRNNDVGAQRRAQVQLGQVDGPVDPGDVEAFAGIVDAHRIPLGILETEVVRVGRDIEDAADHQRGYGQKAE